MKILTVIGARPQFIKAAPVSFALKKTRIKEFLLHTGQHYDPQMSDIFFNELGIEAPNLNLHIQGGSHGQQTGRMIEAIEAVLMEEKPDRVLVYGDTNSTLAGALAATKLHIPVDHIEAGLRSFNKKMPEETNRILTDHVSSFLFTPTETANQNLRREGFLKNQIREVGDVMYDAVLHFKLLSTQRKESLFKKLGIREKSYFIVTIHRAENTDHPNKLKEIFKSLSYLSKKTKIIFPIHPRTKKKIDTLNIPMGKITFIDPVGYLDMLALTSEASLVLTDSGGLQKEAYFLKVPCITLRDQTEWIELVESGWNRLLPINEDLLENLKISMHESQNTQLLDTQPFYGKGDASRKIACFLEELT